MGSHKYSNSTGIWSAGSAYGVMIFCHSERRQVRCTGLSIELLDPPIVLSLDGLARASIKSLQSNVMYSTTATTRTTHSAQRTAPHQLRVSIRIIITYHIVLSYANIWITHVSSSITITQEKMHHRESGYYTI